MRSLLQGHLLGQRAARPATAGFSANGRSRASNGSHHSAACARAHQRRPARTVRHVLRVHVPHCLPTPCGCTTRALRPPRVSSAPLPNASVLLPHRSARVHTRSARLHLPSVPLHTSSDPLPHRSAWLPTRSRSSTDQSPSRSFRSASASFRTASDRFRRTPASFRSPPRRSGALPHRSGRLHLLSWRSPSFSGHIPGRWATTLAQFPTTMLSKKIEAALDGQVATEAMSSQAYLAMASWAGARSWRYRRLPLSPQR